MDKPTIDQAGNLVDHLDNIHDYVRQHLKLTSDRKKTRYDRLASCTGYFEGNEVWFYRPTLTKGESSKRQSSLECPYNVVTQINDVVYKSQRKPR